LPSCCDRKRCCLDMQLVGLAAAAVCLERCHTHL
jgi:hypothetical protein